MIEGEKVDRYRIEKTLYEGEHASVYRARHKFLGSRHALKIQNIEVPEEIPEALLNEARLQSSVHHRNVLGVSDAFDWQRRVVLVMDYVRSESLAELIERVGTLPLRSSLSLFRGIVRGTRALHISHIVHRDLKPENILLAKEEGRVVPKIADFGLAKLLDPGRPPEPSGLSVSYRYLGTPEYMAPEQARDPGRVDTRADMFSLGALLYELVTGHMAFEAETAAESMYRAAKGEYVDPSALNPDAPLELVVIIQELLQRKADKRLPTCDKLLERLDVVRG
ncbi:MAG: serine/threonine protein kinase [Alphaproteobacteria bacterium]|nr:serine/threonine protein kinase [Alphaproteobacteria bacterium]